MNFCNANRISLCYTGRASGNAAAEPVGRRRELLSIREESLEIISRLQELYLVQRNIEAILPLLDDEITWIGSGKSEFCHGIEEARRRLLEERREYAYGFEVERTEFDILVHEDELCVISGFIFARAKNHKIADLDARFTAVVRRRPAGLRIQHVHFSHPDWDQESGSYFVLRDRRILRVQERTLLLQTEEALTELTENIPGGIIRCLNDEAFTLENINCGFLDMFGYNREEIRSVFRDQFVRMILPQDRVTVMRRLSEAQEEGRAEVELEYRVRNKAGQVRAVLDRARFVESVSGKDMIYRMLVDITERKQQQTELRLSLERHQVILDQTTDVIFEWDLLTDTMSYSAKWETLFGYTPISKNITQKMPRSDNIHPDDMQTMRKMISSVLAGTPYLEHEFRIRDIKGHFRWCRVRATVQYDEDDRPIKAIGVIADIDGDKRRTQRLLDQAQKDGLTGLLNRNATQSAIEQHLSEQSDGLQALFIIDLDNFKQVNDRFGHLCGDAVLSDTAAMLKKIFRSSDIVGRIGGDEFLAFMPDLHDKKTAMERAESIRRLMRGVESHLHLRAPVSCSVGIAFSPSDAREYSELYHCADCALYHVKNEAKNGCAIYEPAMSCERCIGGDDSMTGGPIDFDAFSGGDAKLSQYCFRTLSEAGDLAESIPRVMEIVGRAFEASRVYIFESTPGGTHCNNTFEWCGDGVASQLDNLQNLCYAEDLADYQRNFDEDGIFCCMSIEQMPPPVQELLRAQGIMSMLQLAMRENGEFLGFVGFDQCRNSIYWSREQISSITLVASVIATFLRKMRMQEQLRQLRQEKEQGE